MTSGLLNPTHIAVLLIVVLLVLGPKKLPDTGRSLGRAMREFRDGVTGREPAPAEMEPPAPAAIPSSSPPAVASTVVTQEQATVAVPAPAAAGTHEHGLSSPEAPTAPGPAEKTAA